MDTKKELRPAVSEQESSDHAESETEPVLVDRSLLRLGAVLGILGVLLQMSVSSLHPHRVDPNSSASVFAEYAQSPSWTMVHIGQFVGALLIVLGLVALARSLSRQSGVAGALAVFGAVTAVLVAAVFAVQMAVDGVALKATIETWVSATVPANKAAAFQVAESIRWIEKGLSGFFHIVNGATLLALGLSVALGRRFARWVGWFGVFAGAGFLATGVITAETGFSDEAQRVVLPATLAMAIFLIGSFVSMWRRAAR